MAAEFHEQTPDEWDAIVLSTILNMLDSAGDEHSTENVAIGLLAFAETITGPEKMLAVTHEGYLKPSYEALLRLRNRILAGESAQDLLSSMQPAMQSVARKFSPHIHESPLVRSNPTPKKPQTPADWDAVVLATTIRVLVLIDRDIELTPEQVAAVIRTSVEQIKNPDADAPRLDSWMQAPILAASQRLLHLLENCVDIEALITSVALKANIPVD